MLEFLCGGVVGVTHLLLGQPLDYLKVKLQLSNISNKKGLFPSIKQIVQKNGYRSLFKGSAVYALGLPIITGVQFSVYEALKCKLTQKKQQHKNDQSQEELLKLHRVGIAGMGAGVVSSLLACPIQYAKIQRQINIQQHSKGSLNILWNQIKRSNFRKLYTGISFLILRQAFGGYAYFLAYEAAVRQMCEYKNISRKFANFNDFLVGGAAAGLGYWLLVYPWDLMKSRVQAGMQLQMDISKMQPSNRQAFIVAVTRGIFINAFGLALYEQVKGVSEMVNLMSKM